MQPSRSSCLPCDGGARHEPFRCETSRERDHARIVPIGELDLATVAILTDEIEAARSAGARNVVVDLRRLTFMDSTGLRLILDCDSDARRGSYTLGLISGPKAVERVFEITDTRRHLPFIGP